MKFLFNLTAIALIFAAVVFNSCDDDDPVPPVVFSIEALAYNDVTKDFQSTTATLTVMSGSETLYSGELLAESNTIEIPAGFSTYTLSVTKTGYVPYSNDFTEEELIDPLEVRLLMSLTDGLMAWYPFNDNAQDASGNGLHGTFSTTAPTATVDKNGDSNKAYQFNGTTYITIPAATLKLNVYTYSVWANANPLPIVGETGNVFSIGDEATTKHQSINISNKYATAEATGWCVGGWNDGATQNSGVTSGNLPVPNQWYHIVMVRSASHVTMYLNNQLVGSSATDGFPPLYGSTNIANIGIRCNFQQAFSGKIDEFRIYNRVLTTEEIGNLYYKY
jgi:hypothetical protein